MEAQEEVVGSSKDQQTHIVKGKRTKRQRPQSPVPFAITTNSSSGDNDTNINTNTNTNLSPTTSAHEFILDSTEEEEDMANCLILLAQGQSPLKHIQEDKIEDGIYKFNSRRYIQDAPDNGKASGGGLSVYECKTCSRTFPSFQALGGHRASHKKLKVMAEEQNKKQFVLSDEEAEGVLKNNFPSPPPLSLQLGNIRHSNTNNNKSNKVHECSVCGAEFTSGQALGGHMRRHRGPLMATNTSLSLTTTLEPEEESEAKKPTRNLLSLDLNLPAPEDDHHRESKFTFTATAKKQHQQQQQQQQSPALVFSAAPALVDCHY